LPAWSVETVPFVASATRLAVAPQLKAILSELMPGFSLVKPWEPLHFNPIEYPVTKGELAGLQKAAMQSGVSFCFLSTWEQG